MYPLKRKIRKMMLEWPTVHSNRALCLSDIFLKSRRGFWGDPTDKLPSIEKARAHALASTTELFEQSQKEDRKMWHDNPERRDETLQKGREFYERRLAEIHHIMDNTDAAVRGEGNCPIIEHFSFYSEHGGTLLQSMTEGAPTEWVTGAREMCALLLACPFEENDDKVLAKNQRVAKGVLKDLDKRFGPAPLPDVSYVTWEEFFPHSVKMAARAAVRAFIPKRED